MSSHDPHTPRFRSRDQLLAAALAIEREAASRYRELAEASAISGNVEIAALFRDLEKEELEHVNAVEALSGQAAEHAPAAAYQWQMSEIYDPELIEGDPARLTCYRALSIAVLNEERAFAFYSYAAAYADDEEVARAAESFAQEELRHAALLRKQRRIAYRQDRDDRRHRRWAVTASSPADQDVLAAGAAALETAMAGRYRALAERLRGADEHEAAAVLDRVAKIARREAEALRSGAVESDQGPALPVGDVGAVMRDVLLDLEEVCEFYLRVADHAREEGLLDCAQRLAESAVARIALLRNRPMP